MIRRILKQTPKRFRRTYVAGLYVSGNLVVRTRDYYGRTIRTFIYVLMDVLYYLYCGVYLDVNIRTELLQ